MVDVTDEMVERFRQVSGPYLGLPKPPCGALLSDQAIRAWKKEAARGILEKTLNPPTGPQEPEIVVTEAMCKAGAESGMANGNGRGCKDPEWLTAIYRAMRRLEPKGDLAPSPARGLSGRCGMPDAIEAAIDAMNTQQPVEPEQTDPSVWVWCEVCRCSYPVGSSHGLYPRLPLHRRSGYDRRTAKGWTLGYGNRTSNGRRSTDAKP